MEDVDGAISITPQIGVKVLESERNRNGQYLSKLSIHDAKAVDMWSLGIIIYYCFVGKYPYKHIAEIRGNENKGQLKHDLAEVNLLSFITPNIVSLLKGLLVITKENQLLSSSVIKHIFFKPYYLRYSAQINRGSAAQKKQLLSKTSYLRKIARGTKYGAISENYM